MSSSPAPAPATAPTPAPVLCQGNQIEYKAFARHYAAGQQVATLVLLATCNFNSSGYSIAFQPTATGFQLMEQPPGGIVSFSRQLLFHQLDELSRTSPVARHRRRRCRRT